ncbi:MAG: phosphoribosylformylglycinamidine cyclo-ligase [Caulobacteraceae bacterium]
MRSNAMQLERDPLDVYRDAGVDTGEADAGLQRLVRRLRGTWPAAGADGEVKLDIGYFANVVNFAGTGLAMCTDGVGSKAIIAQMMDRYDTIGIDCVAMNVNDLICVGARPVSMVDYIAVQTANADLIDALSIGLAEGARQAGVSISGGEISQMKDIIGAWRPGYGFDLVGMAVGEVPLDRINSGAEVADGDIVIGIASNGIHSNGLSLARRAFFELNHFDLGETFGELERHLGEELLAPTFIYVREVLDVFETVPGVKAMVHITSDGLLNLTRVRADVGYVIDALPPPPPIFSLIEKYARVDRAEMFQVYNMGVGFCLVVSPAAVDPALAILKRHGRKASVIGRAVAQPGKEVRVDKLVGHGKRFHRVT